MFEKDNIDFINEFAISTLESVTAGERDSAVAGATFGQIRLIIPGVRADFTEQQFDQVYNISIGLDIKLGAMKYHQQRFEDAQSTYIQNIRENIEAINSMKKGILYSIQELTYEFEAFFFQFKSALDMLVKILQPVFDAKSTGLHTYGSSGEDVIKYLNHKKKSKIYDPNKIDVLIKLIRDSKDIWIKPFVSWRDSISHYKPYTSIGFTWDHINDCLKLPVAKLGEEQVPISNVLKDIFRSLVLFSRNFLTFSISCALVPDAKLELITDKEKQEIGKYWDMDLSDAMWKLNKEIIDEYNEDGFDKARKKIVGNT